MAEKTLEEKVAELQNLVAKQADTISTLSKGHNSLAKENKAIKEALAKTTSGGGASDKPEPFKKAGVPTKTFSVEGVEGAEGKKYRFLRARFLHKKEKATAAVAMTAQDALNDAQVLAELVARGSGMIEEVN